MQDICRYKLYSICHKILYLKKNKMPKFWKKKLFFGNSIKCSSTIRKYMGDIILGCDIKYMRKIKRKKEDRHLAIIIVCIMLSFCFSVFIMRPYIATLTLYLNFAYLIIREMLFAKDTSCIVIIRSTLKRWFMTII